MKIDDLVEEESGIKHQADSIQIMAENSLGQRILKRGCLSEPDDDELRPTKVQKISDAEDSTVPIQDNSVGNARPGPSIHMKLNNCEVSVKPGCSRDSNVFDEDSLPENDVKHHHDEEEEEEEDGVVLPIELMSLSDDVLLIIMSHLKPTDLLNLSLCCQRLSQVASDWTLWVHVNFRPHSLFSGQLERFLPFLSDTTESIATRGFVESRPLPRWKTECLSSNFLSCISNQCSYLRSFTAEEHCIDANKLKISAFPPTLEFLSLRRSEVINRPTDASYFYCIFRHLPHLKVLELSDCTWLPPHSIMALSKLPKLEELYLDGCYLIRDCIPYASLAFSLGFQTLKVLDLRRTGVSDSELSCVNRFNRLTHLYLEYPSSGSFSNETDENYGGPRACHLPGIVSDLGLRSLVISDKPHVLFNNAEFGIQSQDITVMAPLKDKVSLCQIHTLVARNFNLVTDATLNELHFAQSLRHLDLTGTQITRRGLEGFRISRPEVKVVSSFDADVSYYP